MQQYASHIQPYGLIIRFHILLVVRVSIHLIAPPPCAVAVQRVRDPVQEGGAARGGSSHNHGLRQRDGVRGGARVRRAAAAAVGLLRPSGGAQVVRDVRRRGRRGRTVPAVGAWRRAAVAGVRDHRPGDAQPVPVLLR
jgi:hypothetical protein